MSGHKTLNNPAERLDQLEFEFVNNAGATLYDGDIVKKDLSGIATKVAASTWDAPEQAVYATNKNETGILGVVRCPNAAGILVGERGRAIARGYHPAVKVLSAHTVSIGDVIVASDTDGQGFALHTAGVTVVVGGMVGQALSAKTAGTTVIPVFVDVK